MTSGVVSYFALGLGYWLSSLNAFGLPPEVAELSAAGRIRVQVGTAALTVLLWPVALVYDLVHRLRA